MARKWREIRKRRSPEREARIQEQIARESDYSLAKLREARNYTQTQLAEARDVPQNAISKVEHRADVYISTLRSYIEAMGGRLEIRAVFPDAEFLITQFGEIGTHKKQHEHHAVSA